MDISISHSELRAFAGQLNQWAQQMKSTRSSILQRTQSLEQHWTDAQYKIFSVDQFENMSRQLVIIANDLERMQREMQQRLRNM
jgi:hypothetical protein